MPSDDIYSDMEEHTRKEFEAAREELRTMSAEEFADEFEDLLERLDVFDEDTDSMLVQFALEVDEGIEKWRIQHLDNSVDGSLWDQQKYVRDFETDAGTNALGINTFTLTFEKDGAPSRDDAQKALYAAFREASQVGDPSTLLASPDVFMRVDSTDDGFSISYV